MFKLLGDADKRKIVYALVVKIELTQRKYSGKATVNHFFALVFASVQLRQKKVKKYLSRTYKLLNGNSIEISKGEERTFK